MKKNYNLLTIVALLFSVGQVQAALPFFQNFGPSTGCAPGSNGYFYAGGIANTAFDSYYADECYFSSIQTITLSEALVPGTAYTMYLHFAEIYYGENNSQTSGGDGSRTFDIRLDGTAVLANFDIHAIVGSRAAVVVKYDFIADADGRADLTFVPIYNNAKISAVEIVANGAPSTIPPSNTIIDSNDPTFPVEWAELDAKALDNTAVLTWTTAWESNNAGFEIQMGNVGGGFETVEFVEGAGNATEPTTYEFTTGQLVSGSYVFRIKQIDFDGQISLSPMVEATIGTDLGINMEPLQPNPATDYTLIRFYGHEGDEVSLTISTLYGQTVQEVFKGKLASDGQQSYPVSTETMAPGYYFVQLVQEGHITGQRLLVSPR